MLKDPAIEAVGPADLVDGLTPPPAPLPEDADQVLGVLANARRPLTVEQLADVLQFAVERVRALPEEQGPLSVAQARALFHVAVGEPLAAEDPAVHELSGGRSADQRSAARAVQGPDVRAQLRRAEGS